MENDGKLIRDKIPEIVAASGQTMLTRQLEPTERLPALFTKLEEESTELKDAQGLDHQIEELGDVLEVLKALAVHLGTTWARVEEEVAQAKRSERGGFDLGMWVLT